MQYLCNADLSCTSQTWTGELSLLVHSTFFSEAVISGRGLRFHIIAGKYQNGNYLCIPNWNLGCELSDLSDTFWNTESISRQLDDPFAVETIVSGLKALSGLDEVI